MSVPAEADLRKVLLAVMMLFMGLLVLVKPAGAAVNFEGNKNYRVGDVPYSVIAADFNGDGIGDLTVANFGARSNSVSVLLGKAGGAFRKAVDYRVGANPRSVTTADFNSDGSTDLAVPNRGSGNVSVLLGRGNGTFKAAANYRAGDGPRIGASADFNGDGKLDLAVANRDSNNVSILRGRGDGTFRAAVNYRVGLDPRDVTTADFNGDTFTDLAVPNRDSDNVSILLGKGDGTFKKPLNRRVGNGAYSATTADFNGDALTDLAVTNLESDSFSILLGKGNGAFAAARNRRTGIDPRDVITADFDKDNRLDLALANTASDTVSILAGRGDGTFGAAVNYGAGNGPVDLTSGDFDGDGRRDLAVANLTSDNISVLLQTNTNLTLTASPRTLTYGQAATLSGKLTSAAGTPLGGRRVILEQRPTIFGSSNYPRRTFAPVPGQPAGGVTTRPDGTFRLAGHEPTWSTDYRVRFAGSPDSSIRPATSTLDRVGVKVRVSLRTATSNLRLGQSQIISGAVAPEHKDMSVRLTIRRNGQVIARKTVALTNSRYRLSYRPPRAGSYSVVARFPDHPPGHLGNTSPARNFKVRR